MIAIKIKNPDVAAKFGECAGDYAARDCQFWIGETEGHMLPSATLPEGAEVLETPVRFCGGQAWTVRHQAAQDAAKATQDAARRVAGKDNFRCYALRLIKKLREYGPQPHLETLGYTPDQIRAFADKEIASLLARIA